MSTRRERWNSVLGQSLEDLQHETQLAQVRRAPHLSLAIGTLLARVKKTPRQALALGQQARVQYAPPQAVKLAELLARVPKNYTTGEEAWNTTGAGAICSTTGEEAWNTAGAGHQLFRHLWHDGVENQLKADRRVPLDPLLRSRLLIPGRGRICPRRALALVVCRRGAASRSTLLALWWSCSARAIATVCRSCRNMQRSRRSLRRRAEPAPRTSRSDRPPHCCERP